jgi:hypothetical protein
MRMKPIWQTGAISIAALGIALAHHARSEELLGFISGDELLAMCQSSTDLDKANCIGYVTGFVDSAGKFSSIEQTCYFQTRKGATQQQLVDVAVKYLINHPEERHWLAVTPMLEAMKEAFPCSG